MYRQPSLLGIDEIGVDPSFAGLARRWLDAASYVDHCSVWLSGSELVFDDLYHRLRLVERQVRMYDRIVDEPRLTGQWRLDSGEPEIMPVLADARLALSERYGREFDSIGFNLYRTGQDSVAWHRDRHQRDVPNPIVAIVCLGEPRPFKLRPLGGGASIDFRIGHGDLLVMGGATQHNWEHSVPKVAKPAGARLSVTYRHGTTAGVRNPGNVVETRYVGST